MTADTHDPNTADTIVLIHGLWMTPSVGSTGSIATRVAATASSPRPGPAWKAISTTSVATPPLSTTSESRRSSSTTKASSAKLDSPPIIMGHSFGGAFTQILLDRGLGAAGVAIDSAPVKGILTLPFSTLKSSFPALKNPANDHKAVTLTPKEFHYAFTNTLTDEESLAVFERYAVPGPGRVLFQAGLANFNPRAATKVDFGNDDRAPLLVIAGGADHVSPDSVNESTAKHQSKSKAVTAYKEFPGRSHYTLGQDGWEEVADYALDWAEANARTDAAPQIDPAPTSATPALPKRLGPTPPKAQHRRVPS